MAKPTRGEKTVGAAALAAWLFSCVPMMFASIAALALVLGINGASVVGTPFDDFLATWGLPLLVLSLAVFLFAIRRGSRLALALGVIGSLASIAAMLLMGDMRSMTNTMPPQLAPSLLFIASAATLVASSIIAWQGRSVR